ncbi:glucosaminidase domain-containing protein [Spiribacter insolitus]|uniref:Glucosaminidase domain-containing protein n=1 Tax=Spiribacter insolitus TaxID=3122417 RepID=A0ABV3T8M9_9GAMM
MDNDKTKSSPLRTLIEATPLGAIALILALWWLGWPGIANSDGKVPPLEPVYASSAERLEAVFSQAGYFWPANQVPPLTVQYFPDDLSDTPTETRKSLFFRTLLPLVLAENTRIEMQRSELKQAINEDLPEQRRVNIIKRLAGEYDVDGDPLAKETADTLMNRIDTVPASLALAQAAIESGWGTSRFARQGNNLFGEWTWQASEGLKPRDRAKGADHYVRVFDDLRDSVRSYLNNLNSHEAYQRFRSLRARAAEAGREMTPTEMTAGLEKYSQRGWAYVKEVREMISGNGLEQAVANARLSDIPERLALR